MLCISYAVLVMRFEFSIVTVAHLGLAIRSMVLCTYMYNYL